MQDSHGREIDERDRKAYDAGWRAWHSGSDGALDRADARGVRLAWYDGYSDANLADQGGHKWMTLRCRQALAHWDREGSSCGCDTCERVRVEEAERMGAERPAEAVEEAAGTDAPAEAVEAVSEAEGAAAGPATPAIDALAAAAAGVEAVEAPGRHVSPAREVLARVVTLGVEVSFARSDYYGGPISRREMGDALAEIRAGFEAAGFRTGQRLPYGEPFATVWGGGWCEDVTTARVSEIVREAVAEIGHPAVSLTVDGERVPVVLSTLDDVPEHLRLT